MVRPKDKLLTGEQRRVHRFRVTGQVEGAATPLELPGTLAQVRGLQIDTILKFLFRLAKWGLALLLLLFIAALALNGMAMLGNLNPKLAASFDSIRNNPIAEFILRLPISRPAEAIVRWVEGVIRAVAY